jgi:hypothetical protein
LVKIRNLEEFNNLTISESQRQVQEYKKLHLELLEAQRMCKEKAGAVKTVTNQMNKVVDEKKQVEKVVQNTV